MPRPRLHRMIKGCPRADYFKPRGIPMSLLKEVELSLEEMEAIRLRNINGLEQKEAAAKMNTSQSTFQRILVGAYAKISDALVNGKAIKINK